MQGSQFFLLEQFVSKHFIWFPIYRNLFVYSGSEDEFFKDESPGKCNSTEKTYLESEFFVSEVKLKGGINTN